MRLCRTFLALTHGLYISSWCSSFARLIWRFTRHKDAQPKILNESYLAIACAHRQCFSARIRARCMTTCQRRW